MQQCEIELLRNIVNRELTKSELNFFKIMFNLTDSFENIKYNMKLKNSEIQQKMNLSKNFVKFNKSTILKKIKIAHKRRDLTDSLIIINFSNPNFLKTLKLIPLTEYDPQVSYYSQETNTFFYSQFDEKPLKQLLEFKNNEFEFTQLFHTEVDYIEQEKQKLKTKIENKKNNFNVNIFNDFNFQGDLVKTTQFYPNSQTIKNTIKFDPKTGKPIKKVIYRINVAIKYINIFDPKTGLIIKQTHFSKNGTINFIEEFDKDT
ncbi:hypothetical protein, partial sequence, partial [Candidatus Phytoplasma solani]